MIIAGYLLSFLGLAIWLTAIVWQLVEAFKTSTGWGVASIIGLFLCWLPNLLYCFVHFDKGWRILVAALGMFIPLIVGGIIINSELMLIMINS